MIAITNYYKNQTMDFMISFLGLKSGKLMLIFIAATLLTGFIPHFEQYIFFNFFAFVLFNISMLVDIISAIMLSKVRGGGFETNKAFKALIKLLGYNYLLYLSHVVNSFFTSMDSSIFDGMKLIFSAETSEMIRYIMSNYNISPYAVFFYAFMVISLSAIKNFQLSDVFQNIPKFEQWIYKYVDIYKNRPSDRLWGLMNGDQMEKIIKRAGKLETNG